MYRWLIALLLMFLASNPLAANDTAYLTVQNWTSEDVVVYVDGYSMGKVWKGYKETFPVQQGEHKVQSYKCSDQWKASLSWVNLSSNYPNDTVWVCDYNF